MIDTPNLSCSSCNQLPSLSSQTSCCLSHSSPPSPSWPVASQRPEAHARTPVTIHDFSFLSLIQQLPKPVDLNPGNVSTSDPNSLASSQPLPQFRSPPASSARLQPPPPQSPGLQVFPRSCFQTGVLPPPHACLNSAVSLLPAQQGLSTCAPRHTRGSTKAPVWPTFLIGPQEAQRLVWVELPTPPLLHWVVPVSKVGRA